MDKLFEEIRSQEDWTPKKDEDYSYVNINTLKRLADNYFDKMNYRGQFFFEYNDVLDRIELLNTHIKLTKTLTK